MATYESIYEGEQIDEAVGKALELDFNEIKGKENKGTTSAIVLSSASWSNHKYSFEAEYPSTKYDVYIELSEDCSIEEIEAYAQALIVGHSTDNIYTAKGGAPEIDIPVILKVVSK